MTTWSEHLPVLTLLRYRRFIPPPWADVPSREEPLLRARVWTPNGIGPLLVLRKCPETISLPLLAGIVGRRNVESVSTKNILH